MPTKNILCVGGSAGALEAMGELLRGLGDAPVSVCIVRHVGPYRAPFEDTLQRSTPLPVQAPDDGDELVPGRVYVAPPDRHLLLEGDRLRVINGSRENRARPAIDPLFRSAALSHAARVTAALLSGHLDDGVAGLLAVHRCGGIALVQDPETAGVPELPRNAIRALGSRIDAVCSALDIGARAARDAASAVPRAGRIPSDIAAEHRWFLRSSAPPNRHLAKSAQLSCPSCQGPLARIDDAIVERFRCDVGHAFSLQTLAHEQREEVEHALWGAVRALEQRAKVLDSLAERSSLRTAGELRREADMARQQHELIRRLVAFSEPLAEGEVGRETSRPGVARPASEARRAMDDERD